jgi:hypothetical protein
MNRQSDTTLVFETKAEFDAFREGFLWKHDKYAADMVSQCLNGKWQVELLRIYQEDYELGGRYYIDSEPSQTA